MPLSQSPSNPPPHPPCLLYASGQIVSLMPIGALLLGQIAAGAGWKILVREKNKAYLLM